MTERSLNLKPGPEVDIGRGGTTMNKVVKTKKGYELVTEQGTYPCVEWYEKSKDKNWIKLPKDNPTGRTFVGKNDVDKTGELVVETKTSGPRTLGSRLTPDAQSKIADLEAQIKAIKNDPANIVVAEKLDLNTEEGLEAAIAKLQAKYDAKFGKKA